MSSPASVAAFYIRKTYIMLMRILWKTLQAFGLHARKPYKSGYGDFAFAKTLQRGLVYTKNASNNYLELDITDDSDFQRCGIFPFYRLPAEIRIKILQEIRRPLLSIYRDKITQDLMERECIQIIIRNSTFYSYTEEDQVVQDLINSRIDRGIMVEPPTWNGYPQEDHHMYHRFQGFEEQYKYTQIRGTDKPASTPHPFRGRPAIHGIIKKIYLRFHRRFGSVGDMDEVGKCLEYLAHNLTIEELILTIEGNEQNLEDLAKGEGELAQLKSIKDIPVTKNFEVVLRNIYVERIDFAADDDAREKDNAELKTRVLPQITEFLQPTTACFGI
ncbi:hypothetical protein SBOR_0447 [Sclerotinia borealis F-4128]|uniref:Uncharacterized protein n=1 Tax=Sclerotinia borealis (strain F-4128) TaxID=1432307 RepID=W9CSQ3_SCLBF|nr:hypothetical protein SBOR_0447 [Sclerotinia borealis F-4128]